MNKLHGPFKSLTRAKELDIPRDVYADSSSQRFANQRPFIGTEESLDFTHSDDVKNRTAIKIQDGISVNNIELHNESEIQKINPVDRTSMDFVDNNDDGVDGLNRGYRDQPEQPSVESGDLVATNRKQKIPNPPVTQSIRSSRDYFSLPAWGQCTNCQQLRRLENISNICGHNSLCRDCYRMVRDNAQPCLVCQNSLNNARQELFQNSLKDALWKKKEKQSHKEVELQKSQEALEELKRINRERNQSVESQKRLPYQHY